MYKAIIHNAEYGPVDLETLQKWAREKRIQPDTVLIDMHAEERVPAYRLPALQPIFSANVSPPPTADVPRSAPPPETPRPAAAEPAPPPPLPPEGFVVRQPQPKNISSMAWAGGLVIVFALFVWGLSAYVSQQREDALTRESNENLTKLNTALQMYTRDNGGYFPPMETAAQVQNALGPYVSSQSPSAFINPRTNEPYQPNSALSGRKVDEFDIRNLSAIATFFEKQRARERERAVAFADGRVRKVPAADWPRINVAVKPPNTPTNAANVTGRWVQVLTITGNQSTITQPFNIVGPKWRVKYDVGEDASDRKFRVIAHRSAGGSETLIDLTADAGRGQFTQQSGGFYLAVDTNRTFAITVEQLIPDGQVPVLPVNSGG